MLAAITDLSFNLWGYTAVIGNDFATAMYLIMVKNTPAASILSTTVSQCTWQCIYSILQRIPDAQSQHFSTNNALLRRGCSFTMRR